MRNSSKKNIHASSRRKLDWKSIDWKTVEWKVRELQMRIAKSVRMVGSLYTKSGFLRCLSDMRGNSLVSF